MQETLDADLHEEHEAALQYSGYLDGLNMDESSEESDDESDGFDIGKKK